MHASDCWDDPTHKPNTIDFWACTLSDLLRQISDRATRVPSRLQLDSRKDPSLSLSLCTLSARALLIIGNGCLVLAAHMHVSVCAWHMHVRLWDGTSSTSRRMKSLRRVTCMLKTLTRNHEATNLGQKLERSVSSSGQPRSDASRASSVEEAARPRVLAGSCILTCVLF